MVPAFYVGAAGGALKPSLDRGAEGGIEQHANRANRHRCNHEAWFPGHHGAGQTRECGARNRARSTAPRHSTTGAARDRPAREDVTRRQRGSCTNASGPGIGSGGGKAAHRHPDGELLADQQVGAQRRQRCRPAIGEDLSRAPWNGPGRFELRNQGGPCKERGECSAARPACGCQDHHADRGRRHGASSRQGARRGGGESGARSQDSCEHRGQVSVQAGLRIPRARR